VTVVHCLQRVVHFPLLNLMFGKCCTASGKWAREREDGSVAADWWAAWWNC